MIETKIYHGSQTVVPASVRKALGIDEDSLVPWDIDENKEFVRVYFRKKRFLSDIIGIVEDDGRDNVEIKKK